MKRTGSRTQTAAVGRGSAYSRFFNIYFLRALTALRTCDSSTLMVLSLLNCLARSGLQEAACRVAILLRSLQKNLSKAQADKSKAQANKRPS